MSKRNMVDTCPECHLFLWACKCKEPVQNRLPTDREIRRYLNTESLGFRAPDSFVAGFKSGWAAHKDHLPEFIALNKSKEMQNK